MENEPGRFLALSKEDAAAVLDLTVSLAARYHGADDPRLLLDLPVLAAEMPAEPRRFLRRFAFDDELGFCIIGGHLIDDARIGPTPGHWQGRRRPGPEFPEELLLLLYGAMLGEPFGWRTQQNGELVHDVFPIAAHETEQLGTGSKELLTWHTEDAFHPFRADFLLLSALRNPSGVPTTVGELDASLLSGADLDVLFGQRFYIRPDESHLQKNNSLADGQATAAFGLIEHMQSDAAPVAVLTGSRTRPYMRLDPYFMEIPGADTAARQAFAALTSVIDENLRDVVTEPGDVLVLNNHLAVHGRRPFQPRYDGRDRWLKRINVVLDLPRSRTLRSAASCRLIG